MQYYILHYEGTVVREQLTLTAVPYFYITGGDPILHSDFWKFMVLLKSREIPFKLMGNPFHLNDEVCQMLKVCGCEKYQMSLDGMRETHLCINEDIGDVLKKCLTGSNYRLV